MRRAGTLVVAAALLTAPAAGDDAADFNAALGRAATGAILGDAYLIACARDVPDQVQAQRDAAAGWAHRVDLAGYYRLLDGAMANAPGLQDDLTENAERAQGIVDDEIARDSAPCHDLRSALADSEVFDIAGDIRYLLRNASDFGIAVAEAASDPVADGVEVLPLARLSGQIAAKMDEIGSKDGAQDDRDLREAREEHVTEWLGQRAALAIFGRVFADDELREWRGDQQSSFLARCASFADETHEAAMAADVGDDIIISGTIRWLREDRVGGVVSLGDCRVLGDGPDGADFVDMDGDSAGLMLRPPAYEEAYAGPGLGIATRDVDRVLYDAEFSNRLDGFGNGYTDRREDIYVLLRDGTAYRHEWNFAFTDLNVALSREREPDRWFSWNDSWGTVTLTQTGGLDEGETVDLSEARRLAPVPEGQRLEATYYYLNVGMGGGRSDRDYAFSADGQVVYTRSGFVAGNFGTSHIIAVGEDNVTRSSYRFNGFTLLIDGQEGQERHFVALLEGDDANNPEEVIIDGRVHWLREEVQ